MFIAPTPWIDSAPTEPNLTNIHIALHWSASDTVGAVYKHLVPPGPGRIEQHSLTHYPIVDLGESRKWISRGNH